MMTTTDRTSGTFYARVGKRIFDLGVGLLVLCVIWPILLVLSVIVRRSMGTPVMLHQQRPGYRGKPFKIAKFRTMTDERDASGRLLPDERRITPIGSFLRSFSLDELPEIFNVIRGEMSLVGPRPLMMQYLERYTPEQARRHDVMPGITGWVQINGRNNLSWEEKFEFDVWYVDHQSFLLDMRILTMTAWKVLRREGISQDGYVAAEEFMGSGQKEARSRERVTESAKPQNGPSEFGSTHWEHGSEFHLMEDVRSTEHVDSPWDRTGMLFGTGRDAIKAILSLGMAKRGWKRLWVPAYFCQEVVSAIAETGIKVQGYDSWFPGRTEGGSGPRCVAGDVLLVVNHFGLHAAPADYFSVTGASAILEDHTHDPWSAWAYASKADYCVVSLRKTLPVPDGGALWSPKHAELPTQPPLTPAHRLAAGRKREAMALKTQYLKGLIADKNGYRALSMAGEENLCDHEISDVSEWTKENLARFPIHAWREARKRNHEVLRRAVSSVDWLQVVCPPTKAAAVPFSCVMLFDSAERREYVRTKLIQTCIYPAVLWPLDNPHVEGVPHDQVVASRRMLSFHCDMRYSEQDMRRVADRIRVFGSEFKA